MTPTRQAAGVLLLHYSLLPTTPDLIESVRAFDRHSRFQVTTIDARLGYPEGLDRVRFEAIVLHYTMFYTDFAPLSKRFRRYLLHDPKAFKVAMFQDEQAYLPERIRFCADHGIDCIYTCLEAPYSEQVYRASGAPRIISYLPGYVGERLRRSGSRLARPHSERPIDIGYRGRRPPSSWGSAALEKYEIGVEFRQRAAGRGLRLDIEVEEGKRIYGRAWPRFVASCRAMLGTESGAVLKLADDTSGAELPYRTVGPRHFEAAALRTCQILYEGRYSGALEPMVHYIPLRKDFSNLDQVLERFRDTGLRRDLVENSYRDLVASGRFGYPAFIRLFDEVLVEAGLTPRMGSASERRAARIARSPRLVRHGRQWGSALRYRARVARRKFGQKGN